MKKINKQLEDCSREDLIRIIAKISTGIPEMHFNYSKEISEKLNYIINQAISKCDQIGWDFE